MPPCPDEYVQQGSRQWEMTLDVKRLPEWLLEVIRQEREGVGDDDEYEYNRERQRRLEEHERSTAASKEESTAMDIDADADAAFALSELGMGSESREVSGAATGRQQNTTRPMHATRMPNSPRPAQHHSRLDFTTPPSYTLTPRSAHPPWTRRTWWLWKTASTWGLR